MVMEYIPGECVGDVFWHAGSQTYEEWCLLRDTLFSVLSYLDMHEIRYHDLNGGNVIRHAKTGQYYLIDFGQARQGRQFSDYAVLDMLRIAAYGLKDEDKQQAESWLQCMTSQYDECQDW